MEKVNTIIASVILFLSLFMGGAQLAYAHDVVSVECTEYPGYRVCKECINGSCTYVYYLEP